MRNDNKEFDFRCLLNEFDEEQKRADRESARKDYGAILDKLQGAIAKALVEATESARGMLKDKWQFQGPGFAKLVKDELMQAAQSYKPEFATPAQKKQSDDIRAEVRKRRAAGETIPDAKEET